MVCLKWKATQHSLLGKKEVLSQGDAFSSRGVLVLVFSFNEPFFPLSLEYFRKLHFMSTQSLTQSLTHTHTHTTKLNSNCPVFDSCIDSSVCTFFFVSFKCEIK